MASSYPDQARAVDPFASYNSNVVNQLTGIVTRGSNAIDYHNSLQVTSSDSTSVLVLPGIIYKDDMLIEITSQFTVDFTDPSHYVTPPTNPFTGPAGRYYIVLEYSYIKSRPAPKAYIKILLPSQTASFRAGGFPSLFFLKSVDVTLSGGDGQIGSLYNNDPAYPDTRRLYLHKYAGTEIRLPTFDATRDQSRFVYDPHSDQFYLGFSDRWGPIGGNGFGFSGGGFENGDLVYVTSGGNLQKAVSTFSTTSSDGVVTHSSSVGTYIQVVGPVKNVQAEPGVTLSQGDLLYLSGTTPGTVTNNQTSPSWQFVGRVTYVIDSTSVNMLYHRGEPNGIEGVELGISGSGSLAGGTWVADGTTAVYQDIDISGFEEDKVVITLWDSVTEMKIQPLNIDFLSSSIARIYMPFGYAGTLEALILGASATTVTSGSLAKVTDSISGLDWNLSGGQYYADVDVSSINLSKGAAVIAYNSSNEQIWPADIQYDSTSVMKIWMPSNADTVNVVAVGPTNVASTVSTITFPLASGASWTVDGSLYKQEVDISSLGTDDVVFDVKDTVSGERVEHNAASITSGTLTIWMPDNTHDLEITVIG